MSKRTQLRNAIPVLLLSAALGVIAVVTPVLFMTTGPSHRAPLFPWVHVAVDGFGVMAVLGLFAAGLITKLIFRGASFWLIGLSSMAPFPVMAALEMLIDPRSHKRFPIEFVFYLAASVFATVGALSGAGWQRISDLRKKELHGA